VGYERIILSLAYFSMLKSIDYILVYGAWRLLETTLFNHQINKELLTSTKQTESDKKFILNI